MLSRHIKKNTTSPCATRHKEDADLSDSRTSTTLSSYTDPSGHVMSIKPLSLRVSDDRGGCHHSPRESEIYNSKSEVLSLGAEREQHQSTHAPKGTMVPRRSILRTKVGLVGRERERLLLEQAYDRVCCRVQQAPSEIVLVEGESGVGKTALIASLQESVDREDMGLFVRGKYGLHSTSPFEAIVDAATELCHKVMDGEYYLEDVREHLGIVLTDDCIRNLAKLFPILLEMMGSDDMSQQPLNEHSRSSHEFAQKQFLQVFISFWTAVASVHPVILFLDDVQWSDEGSRAFLSTLALDTSSTNLLIVCAFREGEFTWNDGDDDDDGDDTPRQSKLRLTKVVLGPLSQTSVNEVVAQATKLHPEETLELGEIVHRKTHGNAYFCWQFLDMLQALGLLKFSFPLNRWEWDDNIAESTSVSDNVAELLTRKLTRLSAATRAVLTLAACIGHSFDKRILEKVAFSKDLLGLVVSCSETLQTEAGIRNQFQVALDDAVEEGLIEPLGSDKFKFCHDRVQQVAFSMVPDGISSEQLHSILGQRLFELCETEDGKDWMLFSAVDLMTESVVTMKASQFSSIQLARLCLEASGMARLKSAFPTAARYADRGYKLLEARPDCWEAHYSLCLELREASAETHHSYGSHESAVKATFDILTNCRTIDDGFPAITVNIATLLAQGESLEALGTCSALLGELGVCISTKANQLDVIIQLAKVKRLLRGRCALDLLDLHPMTDTRMLYACYILQVMIMAAYVTDKQHLTAVASMTMMRVTLRYGISRYSPCAFAIFGSMMAHVGRLEKAREYGRLALLSEEKYGTRETLPRTFLVTYTFLHHLQEPILSCMKPLEEAYEVGMQVGVLNAAGRCIAMRASIGIHGDTRLDHLEAEIRGHCEVFRAYNLEGCFPLILPVLELVLDLTGQTTDAPSMPGCVEQQAKNNSLGPRVLRQNYRMTLLVVLDDLEVAKIELTKPRLRIRGTHYTRCCDFFFCGLACFGLIRNKNRKSLRYWRLARKYQRELQKFVRCGSVNCVPFVLLLDAESMSLGGGRYEQDFVLQKYRAAILSASDCGFRLCKGLASERTGQHLLGRGDRCLAQEFLRNAWAEFSDFGALAKLSQMERRYDGVCSFDGDADITPEESQRP